MTRSNTKGCAKASSSIPSSNLRRNSPAAQSGTAELRTQDTEEVSLKVRLDLKGLENGTPKKKGCVPFNNEGLNFSRNPLNENWELHGPLGSERVVTAEHEPAVHTAELNALAGGDG